MRKKLIEVALPLEAINAASAREKSIRHGHPSTLHLWWARRPLAACRAVLFAQLVDDPSSHPEEFPTEEAQEAERERLFEIIRNLVKWENSNNEHVLAAARAEILKSTDGNPPPVLDPFCGGGSIPLEAQRLGLEAHASDLNPVAVLITKALIEIPPKLAGRPPVHPVRDKKLLAYEWHGTQGLAEDVRYYGQWMRDEAERRIGHLYPKVKLPKEYGGGVATVIAWLWARTVKCPNPACGAMMPLIKSFVISTRSGKEAWIQLVINHAEKSLRFEVRPGKGPTTDGTVNRRGARCVICEQAVPLEHIRNEGKQKRLGTQLLGIIAEGQRERLYLSPNDEHIAAAKEAKPNWGSDVELSNNARHMTPPVYGLTTHQDLFTNRQLLTLGMISGLISELHQRITVDAEKGFPVDDNRRLADGGTGAVAYADAVSVYLAFALDKLANYGSSLCTWHQSREIVVSTFGLPNMKITWDYTEVNPFSDSSGNLNSGIEQAAKSLEMSLACGIGKARQADATNLQAQPNAYVVSTDPPYYDNVPYADLSDFFYVLLRRTLSSQLPELFSTLTVPKGQELVADPVRQGNRINAQRFFEDGLKGAFAQMLRVQNDEYPLTVFYAFKQAEAETGENNGSEVGSISSTGWETMLGALINVGFQINGTWPVRTEQPGGLREAGRNSLASSIVLVCRPRPESALPATRREFVTALKRELPDALKKLQHGNIAPVDLAQASIGPGMAIFSRYAKVLEADGQPMSVRMALQVINQELDAYLVAQEGESDRDTRFCLAWFEQYGINEGPFGEADVLARAKGTAVDGLVKAGVVHSKAGKVRLLKRAEYPEQWNPGLDHRVTVWECAQHLIRRLHADTGGIEAAAKLVNELGSGSEDARALAYRLYSICERKKWAEEALAYNTLVVEWPAIQDKAAQQRVMPTTQADLFG